MGFYISLSGIVTFKSAGALARRRPGQFPMTGCWSRLIHPISRPSRCAASATSRPSCAIRRSLSADFLGLSLPDLAQKTTANFDRLVRKGRGMKVTVLGCGGSGGVPLIGPGWGECNPDNPAIRN